MQKCKNSEGGAKKNLKQDFMGEKNVEYLQRERRGKDRDGHGV